MFVISLLIAFLAISDQYATFIFIIFFYKMAAGAHFGCPKFTFDRISGHFRLISTVRLNITEVSICFNWLGPRNPICVPHAWITHTMVQNLYFIDMCMCLLKFHQKFIYYLKFILFKMYLYVWFSCHECSARTIILDWYLQMYCYYYISTHSNYVFHMI